MEGLEHKADVLRTESRRVSELRDIIATKANDAFISLIERPEQGQQRRFATATSANERDELALLDGHAHAAQGEHMATIEVAMHIHHFQQRRSGGRRGRFGGIHALNGTEG